MKIHKIILVILAQCFVIVCPVPAQNCSGGAAIFFGNGVYVTEEDARKDDLGLLINKIRGRLAEAGNPVEFDCLNFDVAYNSKEVLKLDLVEATIQTIGENTISRFWRWLSNLEVAPEWFQNLVRNQAKLIDAFAYVIDPDLQKHYLLYAAELGADKRVIVVSHSQGNFYANAAYRLLLNSSVSPKIDNFSIVAVATPASSVEGNDPSRYTTLYQDIIKHVWGRLPPNTTNEPDFFCGDEISCHFFVDSYLTGPVSRQRILDQIISILTPPTPLPNVYFQPITTGVFSGNGASGDTITRSAISPNVGFSTISFSSGSPSLSAIQLDPGQSANVTLGMFNSTSTVPFGPLATLPNFTGATFTLTVAFSLPGSVTPTQGQLTGNLTGIITQNATSAVVQWVPTPQIFTSPTTGTFTLKIEPSTPINIPSFSPTPIRATLKYGTIP